MNEQFTKSVFFLLAFIFGSTQVLIAQSCPEVLTCSGNRNYPLIYCQSGTNQIVKICDDLPFDNPLTIGNNIYVPVKHPRDLPICVEFQDDPPSDVNFFTGSSQVVDIFRASKIMQDVNRIVEEINCICTEETTNEPDPKSEPHEKTKCCFRFNFSEDPGDFIDENHPTGDRNTAGITNTWTTNDCQLFCTDWSLEPTISLNNTAGYTESETGAPRVFFFNGDILPTSSTGSPFNTSIYRANSFMQVLQHEVLHAMGFKIHLDATGEDACPNPRARGSVHNSVAPANVDRPRLSNDEKCMIRGLFCPFLETTLDVKEHRSENYLSVTTFEGGIVWQELSRSETSPIVNARVMDYLGRTFESKIDIFIDRENHRIGIQFDAGYRSPVFLVLNHANGAQTYKAFGTTSR